MSLTLVADHLSPDRSSAAARDRGERIVTFNFDEPVDGIDHPVPSVSPLQQKNFRALFFREMDKLDDWAAREKWLLLSPLPNPQVFVSGQYQFAQSLWPQWKGDKGRMEFPAFRVATGEANVLHELVHVHFPNANRMLAEGLAVHLQQQIGENACYPNFGEDLHHLIRRDLETEIHKNLEDIHLETLAQITTPSMLMLRIGRSTIKGVWAYMIAGSFVRFLIETHGMDKFRALYLMTPLVPLQRDAGAPGRWDEIYGLSLAELELQWKSL
jgi:hypothetical protein